LAVLDQEVVEYRSIPVLRVPLTKPRTIKENASAVYYIDGGFIPEPEISRAHYAYALDGEIVHIKSRASFENPY